MPRADRVVYVRVPAGLKDRIARAAEDEGMSVNAWCARELLRASIAHDTTPQDTTPHDDTPHHTARHDTTPTVTIVDVIRNTTEGTPLLAPCGRTWPCAEQKRTQLAGTDYCDTCGVRLP